MYQRQAEKHTTDALNAVTTGERASVNTKCCWWDQPSAVEVTCKNAEATPGQSKSNC